ncbi:MAG: MATE family efflux transporter [Lachnospiraceae bacterium]|nr:MATE family efflux transporter [Lachnospiraceae bacterium]
MMFQFYDKNLCRVETSQGTMTLSGVFIPFFLEMFLTNFMGTVNTFMLSFFSDDAVAAVGTASQFSGMIATFYTVIGTGASIVISHNLGASKREQASDAVLSALVFGALFSFVVSIVTAALAKPFMMLMHIESDVLSNAEIYFSICMRFSFLGALFSIISAIFKSYGRPRISVGVSLGMNMLNALLNYLVIFRPFDFPLQGVSGIAWCNNISRAVGLLVMSLLLCTLPLGLHFRHSSVHCLKMIFPVLKVGIPGGISSLSYNISQTVTTSIIAIVGMTAISTKIYVSNLVFYVYVLGMSLGLSTSLLIGWLSGAGRFEQAYRLNLQNLKITLILNVTLSLLLFLFGRPLLSLFTSDPEILKAGSTLLFLDIFVELFRGFNHIEENSLRGAGDVMFPMAVSICSCWVISVLFSYLLGVKAGLGLNGCWIAFAMDEAFRGVNYYFRWHSRKWTKKALCC